MIYFPHLLWKLNVIGRLMVIRAVIIENYVTGTITNILPKLTCWTPTRALLESTVIYLSLLYNGEPRHAIIWDTNWLRVVQLMERCLGLPEWHNLEVCTQIWLSCVFHFWIHLMKSISDVNTKFFLCKSVWFLSCIRTLICHVCYFIVISVQQRIILSSILMSTFPTNLLLFLSKVWSHFVDTMWSSFMPLTPKCRRKNLQWVIDKGLGL